MARMPRVVAQGMAHHITQRGNALRTVFDTPADRLVYLHLLRQYSILHQCTLIGYCLMSNHVHLVAVPARAGTADTLLDLDLWQAEWTPPSWRDFLDEVAEPEADLIRRYTHTGRPLGSDDFVNRMERELCRTLAPQKAGRPRRRQIDAAQQLFDFPLTD